ncbi:unnamed protein product [Ascophyllum nodosum]
MFGPEKVKDGNVGKVNTRIKGRDATVSDWWLDLKLPNFPRETKHFDISKEG